MMDDATTTRTQRDAALRAELVSLVEAPTQSRVARPAPTILAAVLAFGLAGAGTGAAVAATSSAGDDGERAIEVSIAEAALFNLGTATDLFGTPVIVTGVGETIVDLGEKPEGATALALRVSCIDDGQIDIEIVDVPLGEATLGCNQGDAPSSQGEDAGQGGIFSQFAVEEEGPHTLSVRGPQSAQYALWVSWSAPPVAPEPSETQQDALADGVVTRDEYLAGLDRYEACMEAAGWSVMVVDRDALIIDYRIDSGAVSDGSDERCYYAEFSEIEPLWQVSAADNQE